MAKRKKKKMRGRKKRNAALTILRVGESGWGGDLQVSKLGARAGGGGGGGRVGVCERHKKRRNLRKRPLPTSFLCIRTELYLIGRDQWRGARLSSLKLPLYNGRAIRNIAG